MIARATLCFGLVMAMGLDLRPARAATTELVSVDSFGAQGNRSSGNPEISGDGRFVAFVSHATNLAGADTNDSPDIFVHDRLTRVTERVSVASGGLEANSGAQGTGTPSISADGRFVGFASDATNLVLNDTNNSFDVFVHDRLTGTTGRVSVASSGSEANSHSGIGSNGSISLSADGRFVAFDSSASNLVAGDTNNSVDVFVHDRQTGTTERVSVDSTGAQALESYGAAISADGRFVAFLSGSLGADDTNGFGDVFVHDRQTGVTERVSVDSFGAQGNGNSGRPAISADGRFVTFISNASNLVAGDTDVPDIFVHDRQTGATERVSVDSSGAQADIESDEGSPISADGRFVAFASSATNLVAGDTNNGRDTFVRDRLTGTTERVSVDSSGGQTNSGSTSYTPAISADGRFVAFASGASNLVAGDTNNSFDVFVRDRGVTTTTTTTSLPTTTTTSSTTTTTSTTSSTITTTTSTTTTTTTTTTTSTTSSTTTTTASTTTTTTLPGCAAFPCGRDGTKQSMCHFEPRKGPQTVCVNPDAVPTHFAHGDHCGPCT